MWRVGDRMRTYSPVHGEMVGTVIEISDGHLRKLLHVRWQTSQTGTIVVKELAGRDDVHWERIEGSSEALATLEQVAPEFLAELDLQLKQDDRLSSAHTRRSYRSDLVRFELWRGERPLSAPLVEQYLAHLRAQDKAASSRRRVLAVIRWWVRRQYERFDPEGGGSKFAELAYRLSRLTDGPPQARAAIPEDNQADPGRFDRLLKVCLKDRKAAGTRDAAILALGWRTGLKRGEIIALNIEDLQISAGKPVALSTGRIRTGQGQLKLDRLCQDALQRWLGRRLKDQGLEESSEPLFVTINKGGRLGMNRMSGEALRLILRRRCRQAGLEEISWGAVRKAFGRELLQSGVDLRTVQRILGHKSAATTVGYL